MTAKALVAIGCLAGMLFAAGPAQGAASDPLFVFVPVPPPGLPVPPPNGTLDGACGLGVDPLGNFYVSDYYHEVIDIYDADADYSAKGVTGATGFLGQLEGIDPLDGPCGLSFGSSALYINVYHRSVVRFAGSFTTVAGQGVDDTHPTGVAVDPASGNVYVDARNHVAVYDSSGAPVMTGPPGSEEPLRIGEGSLGDGYGIAYSQYPGTAGYLYVPDAATDTIKVYDPATDKDDPIAQIDGSETAHGEFVSLRDAAIDVDRVTGEIYVVDNLQPKDTNHPQAVVYAFDSSGAYEGHLAFLITDALPAGLAVDNSAEPTQGRVYVTSGNTALAGVYAYGPAAATNASIKPANANLALVRNGTGEGFIQSSLGARCGSNCEEAVPAGATVTLSAEASSGSTFSGWSGACAGSASTCAVQVDEATSVQATFAAPAEQDPGAADVPGGGAAAAAVAAESPPLASRPRGKAHRKRRKPHRSHRERVKRGK